MAHFTCLAAARHAVLRDSGWDVEADGLHGAPPVRVIASDQAHVTVGVACRMLGLGQERVQSVATDEQGRMRAAALESALAQEEVPTIVCAQAGDINTGAFDPILEIVATAARTAPGVTSTAPSASGSRPARPGGRSSTATWAPTRGPRTGTSGSTSRTTAGSPPSRTRAHSAAMASTSAYIPDHDASTPWGFDWTPEFSRRARGIPVYAALRSLGRTGVAEIVDRCCDHATRLADRLRGVDGIEVLNDVVLNQVQPASTTATR